MNTVFHCLIAGGIAHVAAAKLKEDGGGAFKRSDLPIMACAGGVAFLSHGVIDGLKHGYPFPAFADVLLGISIAACWCVAVRGRFVWLFASAFFASVLPDLIDHLPALLQHRLGLTPHGGTAQHLFPWHWVEGSGSMFPASAAADAFPKLEQGRNQVVSIANHAMVLVIAAACAGFNPAIFRGIGRSRASL
jgi:hypothetical protein